MMGWYGWGWGGWLVMTVAMVAFWGLVVWAVVAIFRSGQSPTGGGPANRDPHTILDERFARGEIDEAEYRARTDLLRTRGR